MLLFARIIYYFWLFLSIIVVLQNLYFFEGVYDLYISLPIILRIYMAISSYIDDVCNI